MPCASDKPRLSATGIWGVTTAMTMGDEYDDDEHGYGATHGQLYAQKRAAEDDPPFSKRPPPKWQAFRTHPAEARVQPA